MSVLKIGSTGDLVKKLQEKLGAGAISAAVNDALDAWRENPSIEI